MEVVFGMLVEHCVKSIGEGACDEVWGWLLLSPGGLLDIGFLKVPWSSAGCRGVCSGH